MTPWPSFATKSGVPLRRYTQGNAGHILRIQHAETPTGEKARLIIERQAGRMTRLIEDLADTSRSNSSELPFQRQRIDLRSVVEQAIETVASELSTRNHRLTTSLPATPMWLHGDSGRLEQVLVNLLVNAAKYTDDGGELWLSAQQEDDEVIIRVRDSGIGIAPDVLPNVFNLFVQVEHSSRRADAGFHKDRACTGAQFRRVARRRRDRD